MGFDILTVSVRPGSRHDGVTIARCPRVDAAQLSDIPWWTNPDLGPVVRELHWCLAGTLAEGLAHGTGRGIAPDADLARVAFEALPDARRTGLLQAEAVTDGTSDEALAWAVAADFCGPDAKAFLDLVYPGIRRFVSEHAVAIIAIAAELQQGSILDGPAIDTVLAVGEGVELSDGAPTSGTWTPLTTVFVSHVEAPARRGETYPWHDARVQRAPALFVPADAPACVIEKAVSDYRDAAAAAATPKSPMKLATGPGVVRCTRQLVGRTRDGRMAITVGIGDLARAESWYAKRWPMFFEPTAQVR
jgi:hypothetical protein